MNNLNSVLAEGAVFSRPAMFEDGTCRFSLQVERATKEETSTTYVEIAAHGQLGELCKEHLEKGRVVRVVGRLAQRLGAQDDDGLRAPAKLYIAAEHIEFRPSCKIAKEAWR